VNDKLIARAQQAADRAAPTVRRALSGHPRLEEAARSARSRLGTRMRQASPPSPGIDQKELAELRRRVKLLGNRVKLLEDEVQEGRRLHRRVAELTDIVVEILVPAADRDDERLRLALERYEKGL
jgi:hypothetical protein